MSLESRRAVDSTDEVMGCVLPVRMLHELRLRAGRLARVFGFSNVSEFIRHMIERQYERFSKYDALARANGFDNVDRYVDWLLEREDDLRMEATLHDDDGNLVLRNTDSKSFRAERR